ncbi:MAG: methyltransferase domain-containing protein, partial [Patescibacteria group bacterium]
MNFEDKLNCPSCRSGLQKDKDGFFCPVCRKSFPVSGEFLDFLDSQAKEDIRGKVMEEGASIRNFFKRWPGFYYFIANFFGPLWFSGLSAEAFLKEYKTEGLSLNLGSGPKVFSPAVINVDVFPFSGVKVLADISKLPLCDNSVSSIILDNVIEHLLNPEAAAGEARRVLEKGGMVYVCAPFLYPFHSSPRDFHRWTKEGLIRLFADFEIVEAGVRSGPFSALTAYLCYFMALTFSLGSKKAYWLMVNLFMFLFFPLKIFDIIYSRLPQAIHLSAMIY